MILEWLAPENSIVQAGQVIARFYAQRILKDSRDEELEMLKLQQDTLFRLRPNDLFLYVRN